MDTDEEMNTDEEMEKAKVTMASAREKRIERYYHVLKRLEYIITDSPLDPMEVAAMVAARNALEKLWQIDQRECNAIIRRAARETQ